MLWPTIKFLNSEKYSLQSKTGQANNELFSLQFTLKLNSSQTENYSQLYFENINISFTCNSKVSFFVQIYILNF